MISESQNKNSSTNANQPRSLSYEEAKAIIERLDEDIVLQFKYNETRLAEELALAEEDNFPFSQAKGKVTLPPMVTPVPKIQSLLNKV